jgi:hypothetical protein
MKILLDECVPQDLCKEFLEHECHAARRAGFGGKKNGELLALAEAAGFDVLITVDRSIPFQQNLTNRRIAVLIINVRSNRLEGLLPHMSACLAALPFIKLGEILQVG